MATKKRKSGPSGLNQQPQRQLRANDALWALVDRAIEHAGGTWSPWARRALVMAAAKELGISQQQALELAK
jgi:hypothetical protein